nr:MAG TPA: hypothetical protein [Caudoviricetes sp.]
MLWLKLLQRNSNRITNSHVLIHLNFSFVIHHHAENGFGYSCFLSNIRLFKSICNQICFDISSFQILTPFYFLNFYFDFHNILILLLFFLYMLCFLY